LLILVESGRIHSLIICTWVSLISCIATRNMYLFLSHFLPVPLSVYILPSGVITLPKLHFIIQTVVWSAFTDLVFMDLNRTAIQKWNQPSWVCVCALSVWCVMVLFELYHMSAAWFPRC
jgi:hypothetical protein